MGLGSSRWDSVWTTYATQGCAKARKARLASALGFDRVVPSGRQSIAPLRCSDNPPLMATWALLRVANEAKGTLPSRTEIVPLLTGVVTGFCSVLTKSVERERILRQNEQPDFGSSSR